jgi:YHS domain-containing protein
MFAAFVLFALLGPGSAFAQHDQKGAQELAIGGYCPVAYVAMNKAMKPDGKITATYKGHTYAFMNQDAKKMFEAEPAKYAPKYEGTCATAVAMGQKMESDPKLFSVHKNNLYLFSNKDAKAAFDKDPAMTVARADKQWAVLSNK